MLVIIRICIRMQELLKKFSIVVFTTVKASHHEFGSSPKICRLVDLMLDELKAVIPEVWVVGVILLWSQCRMCASIA